MDKISQLQAQINFLRRCICKLQDTTGGEGGGIELKTNGVANGSQSLLNLMAGTNVTLTDDGVGSVTINANGGGSSERFGIEDNLGTQDRSVDMQSNDFSIDNYGDFYFGHYGSSELELYNDPAYSGVYITATEPVSQNSSAYLNMEADDELSTIDLSSRSPNNTNSISTLSFNNNGADVDNSSQTFSLFSKAVGSNTFNSSVSIIGNADISSGVNTRSLKLQSQYNTDILNAILPDVTNAGAGDRYITLSVNENYADATGNIPVSFQSVLDNDNTVGDGKGFDITDGAGQHLTVTDLVNSGWIKSIVIDQPTTAIYLKNGNSDNGGSGIQRIGNNVGETRIFSKNATNGSAVPINGYITNYCYDTSNTAVLKQIIGNSGNAAIGVLNSASSGAADPTTSDIPSGFSGIWKNTTTGVTSVWYNNAGTLTSLGGSVDTRPVMVVLGSNQTTTATTTAGVTGLSVSVAAGKKYRFRASLKTQCSTANGIKLGVNVTGTGATLLNGTMFANLASTTANRLIDANTITGSSYGVVNTVASQESAIIELYFTTTNTGTAQIFLGSQTAGDTSTILAGSTITLIECQ